MPLLMSGWNPKQICDARAICGVLIVGSSKDLHITYFWECLEDFDTDLALVTTVSHDGRTFEWEHRPLFGLAPGVSLKKGDVFKDEQFVELGREYKWVQSEEDIRFGVQVRVSGE